MNGNRWRGTNHFLIPFALCPASHIWCWELQLLEGGVSRFHESEEGKCYDVSYATGVVAFTNMHFHKLIQQPFDDKLRVSSHENLSFKLTDIICVIQGTNQTGSQNSFPFPIDYRSYFSGTKVPWDPPEGAWPKRSMLYLNWAVLSCGVWPFSYTAFTRGQQAVTDRFSELWRCECVCVCACALERDVQQSLPLRFCSSHIDQRQLDYVCPYGRSQALFMSLWRTL